MCIRDSLDIELNNGHILVSKGIRDGIGTNFFYYFYYTRNYLNIKEPLSNIFNSNKLTFFAVVISKHNPIKVYVDGYLRFMGNVPFDDDLSIINIKISYPVYADSHYWKGYIMNFMLFSRALSDYEIKSIFYSLASQYPKDGLILWYTFNPKYISNEEVLDMASNINAVVFGTLEKYSEEDIKNIYAEILVPPFMDAYIYDVYGNLLDILNNDHGIIQINVNKYSQFSSIHAIIKVNPFSISKKNYELKKIADNISRYRVFKCENWKIYYWNKTHIAIETKAYVPESNNYTFILSSTRSTKVFNVNMERGVYKIMFFIPHHVYVPRKYPFGDTFFIFPKIAVITNGELIYYELISYENFFVKMIFTGFLFFILFLVLLFKYANKVI